jgi:hypothetical protein
MTTNIPEFKIIKMRATFSLSELHGTVRNLTYEAETTRRCMSVKVKVKLSLCLTN